MFGLSFTHLLFLGLLALILIGPEELPAVARTVGRFLNEIKRGSDSFKDEFRRSANDIERQARIEKPDLSFSVNPAPTAPADRASDPTPDSAPPTALHSGGHSVGHYPAGLVGHEPVVMIPKDEPRFPLTESHPIPIVKAAIPEQMSLTELHDLVQPDPTLIPVPRKDDHS